MSRLLAVEVLVVAMVEMILAQAVAVQEVLPKRRFTLLRMPL
jgi:hypothetical protein